MILPDSLLTVDALLLLDVSHVYLPWNFSLLVVTYWALTVVTGLTVNSENLLYLSAVVKSERR